MGKVAQRELLPLKLAWDEINIHPMASSLAFL